MITRIVKMQFRETFTDTFISVFKTVQPEIGKQDGCSGVSLLNDSNDPTIFFTISYWETEMALESYRNSALFKETWATVKPHFAAKAEAWSLTGV